MARCTRCAIDVPDDAERCPKCLRTSTLTSATASRELAQPIGWGGLPREREAPLGWAPTIMAVGFLVILGFASYAVQTGLPDGAVMRWSSLGALALIYGFKRELDAIGLARTLGVFLAVCLVGAILIVGSGVALVLLVDRSSWKPSQTVMGILAIVPAVAFVVGTWWVTRRLDRARLRG